MALARKVSISGGVQRSARRRTTAHAPDADAGDDFLRRLVAKARREHERFVSGGGKFARERGGGLPGAAAERGILVVDEQDSHRGRSHAFHPLAEQPVAPEEKAFVGFAGHVRGVFLLGKGDVEMRKRARVVELEASFAQPAADRHAETLLFPRDDFARDSSGASAFFKIHFVWPPRSLSCHGMRRARSTTSMSRKGERASSEHIIEARSTFARMPSCR